jgi:signal transduction histidine kinase
VPGLLLAVFGARALWQEKRGAEGELGKRLERATDVASRALEDEVTKLQSLLDEGLPPENTFRALPADGSWAFAERDDNGVRIYPPNVLPYEFRTTSEGVEVNPDLKRIQQLEMRDGPDRAIADYRDLLVTAPSFLVPEIQYRLARALRNAGRTAEAVLLWQKVEREGGRIGFLPADLVAGFELALLDDNAASAFYQDLAGGRWRLEKARYLYYDSEIRKRIGLNEEDSDRFTLADAVDAATSSSLSVIEADRTYFAFRRKDPSGILVVSSGFFDARVWPKVFNTLDSGVHVVSISANGKGLYSSSRHPLAPLSIGKFDNGGVSWKVEVEPDDAAGFYAAMNRKTNLYLAMLLLVVISLGAGGYFIARTVRRELEVARMKSEFVSTVSHEFRSPLTGIRQLGEMLARDRITDDSKRYQYYQLIVRESERLARLVENVLDFSRMEAGRKQYRFELLDTSTWLNSVAQEFQMEATRSGYCLQTDIPDQLPAISADREALATAVRNLLDNACKYSPSSKFIWLAAEAANGQVCMRVRDRGIGIASREQHQIFEKFYRGGALAKDVKGVGLGLSLVQQIVEAHRGKVLVESNEGEGSTFSIFLRAAS